MMNMKKICRSLLFVAMSLIAFTACEDEGMSADEIKQILGKSNISDAKYIYIRQESVTRAEGAEVDPKEQIGAWKVDKDGNETKVRIYDIKGKELNTNIWNLSTCGDSYVRMHLRISTGKSTNDLVEMIILVDKNTNKIYECPLYLWEKTMEDEYSKGILYYCGAGLRKATITPTEIVDELLTLYEDAALGFFISKGEVAYFNDSYFCPYYGGGEIMMPSKRRYPVKDDYVFISGDRDLFSIKKSEENSTPDSLRDYKHELYYWQLVSDTQMERVKVGNFPGEPDWFLPMNKLNGKAVAFCRNSHNGSYYICEVDKESIVIKKSYTTDDEKAMFDNFLESISSPAYNNGYHGHIRLSLGNCNYCMNDNYIMNFDANTYEITEAAFVIPDDEYKVTSKEIDSSTGKIIFKAIRYLDSANVLGEVDKNGVVKIVSVTHPQYQITTYCALN